MTKRSVAVTSSLLFLYAAIALSLQLQAEEPGKTAEVVSFPSGTLTLSGVLYRPAGTGPFPVILWNHGSASGMLSQQAFDSMGPVFAGQGWVYLAPWRRGQGLSASAGPYIGDEIAAATKKGGTAAGAATMIRLLEGDHLNDQLAGLRWLRTQTPLPLCVGFGVATPEHVRMLRETADGVIVGSALVRKLERKRPIDEIVRDVGDLVQQLASALHDK